MSAKESIKKVLPEIILRQIRGITSGWHGNYSKWEDAQKNSTGYDSVEILNRVKSSTMKVKKGLAVYERDSFLFDKIQYSFPLLSSLMWIAALRKGKINVLDFGGSLGSSYYQNKKFLDTLQELHWCVVEQPGFVEAGKEDFAKDKLHFFKNIKECIKAFDIDVVLLSSVLQYLEKPYDFLRELFLLKIEHDNRISIFMG